MSSSSRDSLNLWPAEGDEELPLLVGNRFDQRLLQELAEADEGTAGELDGGCYHLPKSTQVGRV